MEDKPAQKFISHLSINGLDGRVLRLPAPKNKDREILLLYGHHASLERILGLATALNRYGSVTTPDLPGFGGMASLYKIGKKPTIDNLADYLAAFIKMRYKKRNITIIGVSLGFAVATRMLQKYPQLAGRVDLMVSAIGFVHKNDFKLAPRKKFLAATTAGVLSWWLPGLMAKALLRKPVIRYMYRHDTTKAHDKNETAERRNYRIGFEVWLWQNNDIRTHFYSLREMLRLNLCDKKVDLPVYHVAVDVDQYIDNHVIEQHMRVIFNEFTIFNLPKAAAHAPTIIATAKEAGVFIPPGLRRMLNKKTET